MPVTGQRVVRRALARRLTRLRTAAGMTRREVADAKLGMSEPTLHRIETGKVPVTQANVRALCWLYRVDQSVTDALAELAIGTAHEEWWDTNPVLPEWFKLYVGLEASAIRLRTYDGEIVPGELQTEDYALAVFGAAKVGDEDEGQRHVALRVQRQGTLFGRKPPPQIVTVIGEAALIRPVGGPEVLKAQIEHLRVMDKTENVEVRVLQLASGAHAAMAGAFRILDFDDPEDPEIVYLESHVGALYLEEPEQVAEYRRIFDLVMAKSIPLSDYP